MTISVVIVILIYLSIGFVKTDNNNKFFDRRIGSAMGISGELPDNSSVNILIGPFIDKDNQFVENAKITLFVLNRTLINHTNDFGIVEFEIDFIIPKDSYQLKVEADGYEPLLTDVEIEIYD